MIKRVIRINTSFCQPFNFKAVFLGFCILLVTSLYHRTAELIRLFQDYDMKILVELNLTQTDFLDATLNLKTGKFWPYRKPNDNPLYVNKNSNHPPSIKKQIPSMVNDRLTQLSSSENEFDRAAPIYNKALHESGYDIYLKYRKEAKATKTISNRRRRNIVWFNPHIVKTLK